MVKKLKKMLIGSICFSVALYLFLLFHYSGKKVHLSIDDVSICMKELTNDSSEYNSIFEQSFLKTLSAQYHERVEYPPLEEKTSEQQV